MRFMYLHLYLIIQRARPKRLALEFRRMTNESARYVRALRPVRDFLVRSFGETGLSLSLSAAHDRNTIVRSDYFFAAQSPDNCYHAYCSAVSVVAFWSASIWNERSGVVRIF